MDLLVFYMYVKICGCYAPNFFYVFSRCHGCDQLCFFSVCAVQHKCTLRMIISFLQEHRTLGMSCYIHVRTFHSLPLSTSSVHSSAVSLSSSQSPSPRTSCKRHRINSSLRGWLPLSNFLRRCRHMYPATYRSAFASVEVMTGVSASDLLC